MTAHILELRNRARSQTAPTVAIPHRSRTHSYLELRDGAKSTWTERVLQ
jgi:hypothetical protein